MTIVAKVAPSATKGPRLLAEKIAGIARSVPEEGSLFGTRRVPLEEHMKRLTKILIPALMLGAIPALAQNAANTEATPGGNGSPAAAAPAQPAQDANSA